MALRVRFQYDTGASLGYSIERLADGWRYDFSDGAFKASPTTAIDTLNAEAAPYLGRYTATLTTTPSPQFPNGQYAIGIHDTKNSNVLIGLLGAVMYNGDDAPVFPVGSGSDPWGITLPGSYGPGTAGHLLGTNLDAAVSTRSTYSGGPVASVIAPVTVGSNQDKVGYSIAQAFPANFSALEIASDGFVTAGSVRDKDGYALSTAGLDAVVEAFPANVQAFPANFAALEIAPDGSVTAGSVRDKDGYALSTAGLDAVVVETGINARQALSPILAASAGTLNGAGTGTITIQGGNVSTTRITATTDSAGNRSSVVLTLPT